MRKLVCFLLLCFFLFQTAICESVNPNDTQELSLMAINVGKADCLLLRSGETTYLIDTGTKKTANQVLKILYACGIDHLNGNSRQMPYMLHLFMNLKRKTVSIRLKKR